MVNSIKARTPILALILFLFAMGYTFAANKVVVIPLGADDPVADCQPGFLAATAKLDIRSISTTEFTSSGVSQPYTCNGDQILAKKTSISRVQVIEDSSIGSRVPKFGTITTNGDLIFTVSSPLLNCSSTPQILCLSFDFRSNTGANTLPNDSMFLVVYGR